jgi:Raf kinase inhibitor-like YbhB/YbcL family protein
MKELKISSPAFQHNGLIPSKYTCDGENINPTLNIEDIPQGTQSLALVVDDPDAPMGTWDHWTVWNIPLSDQIKENSVPGTEGMNSARRRNYGGPCPPFGTHRYFFKVYALDTKLTLNPNSNKKDLEKAMQGHTLAKGEIIGKYARKK